MTTKRAVMLSAIERSLLAIGLTLAGWCALVIVQARYFSSLPIPAASTLRARVLPGETPGASPSGRSSIPRGTWIARLESASGSFQATVLEGSDDGTLRRAAGHIEGTSLPGESGNVGIAGHRDTTFRPIRNLHVGDMLVVTTADHTYRYRVTGAKIVPPDAVSVLDPAKHPTLTLVTCYPFTFIGHAPERYVVSADLVTAAPRR